VTVPPNDAARLVGFALPARLRHQQLTAKVGAASKAVVYQWESSKRKPSPIFWLRIVQLNRQRSPALDS
jgi:hypothetical protein